MQNCWKSDFRNDHTGVQIIHVHSFFVQRFQAYRKLSLNDSFGIVETNEQLYPVLFFHMTIIHCALHWLFKRNVHSLFYNCVRERLERTVAMRHEPNLCTWKSNGKRICQIVLWSELLLGSIRQQTANHCEQTTAYCCCRFKLDILSTW